MKHSKSIDFPMYDASPNDYISSSSSSLDTKDDSLILLSTSSVHEKEKENASVVCPSLERRRPSFQRLAVGSQSDNPTSALQVTKEAADEARKPRARVKKLREEQASIEAEQATKIQAAYRAYIGRQSLSFSWKPTKKKTHHRFCSELTMTDWDGSMDDSMQSLDFLGGSPVTTMQKMEDVLHQSSVFQSPRKLNRDAKDSSWNTSATMSKTVVQDSFSSIFSQDSIDFPVRAPSRKLSIPRVLGRDSPLQFPKRSPSPTPKAKVRRFRADTN